MKDTKERPPGEIYWIFYDDGWRISEIWNGKDDVFVKTVHMKMKISRTDFEAKYRPKKVKEEFMIKSARKILDTLN